jgi:hypothetical protein
MVEKDIALCFNCNNEFASSDQEIHQARLLLIEALSKNVTFETYLGLLEKYMDSRNMDEDEKESQRDRILNLEVYFE